MNRHRPKILAFEYYTPGSTMDSKRGPTKRRGASTKYDSLSGSAEDEKYRLKLEVSDYTLQE